MCIHIVCVCVCVCVSIYFLLGGISISRDGNDLPATELTDCFT